MEDIRYKQRFENFEKSFLLLTQAISIEKPSIIEEAGVIQFFEITFELAWLFALKNRNLTVHTYDENEADEIYSKIKNEYFELLNDLYLKFKDLTCMD